MHGSRSRHTPRPFSRTALERPSQHFLELDRRGPRVPDRLPELHRGGVVLPHDEIHFRAATFAQALLDRAHETRAEAAPPMILPHGHVIEPAPAAVPGPERGRGE